MKKSTFKQRLTWGLGIFAFLLVCLSAHIYFTTNNLTEGHANLQLYRIDFKQEIDSTTAGKIRGFTEGLPGVTHAFFNVTDKTLVYSAAPGQLDAETTFQTIKNSGNYKAERYIVTEEMASRGCPVMSGSEFTKRIAVYFSRLMA